MLWEQTTYTRQLEEVTETSGGVFGDASNEFAELEYVKNKFEQWKVRVCWCDI